MTIERALNQIYAASVMLVAKQSAAWWRFAARLERPSPYRLVHPGPSRILRLDIRPFGMPISIYLPKGDALLIDLFSN